MNDDLISREALKKELTSICTNKVNDYNKAVKAFIEFIDNAPTVEQSYQAPKDYIRNKLDYSRPQGEWGRWIIYTIKCPECLECFNFPTEHYSMEFLKECPNCGADMRGGKE